MLGGHSGLEPPLPISNRAVKRTSANDSMLFACESRSLPSYLFRPFQCGQANPRYENSEGFLLFMLKLYLARRRMDIGLQTYSEMIMPSFDAFIQLFVTNF